MAATTRNPVALAFLEPFVRVDTRANWSEFEHRNDECKGTNAKVRSVRGDAGGGVQIREKGVYTGSEGGPGCQASEAFLSSHGRARYRGASPM